MRCRRSVLFGVTLLFAFFALFSLFALPGVIAQDNGEIAPRVLVVPIMDRTAAAGYEALAVTVTNAVRVTLPFLGDYDVRTYDGPETVTNEDEARLIASAENVDSIVFGSVELSPGGNPVVTLSIYERAADAVNLTRRETAASILDVFSVSDRVLSDVMGAFSGRVVSFGTLRLRAEPAGRAYRAFLDGQPLEPGVDTYELLLTGEWTLTVFQEGVTGWEQVDRQRVTIEEGEVTALVLAFPPVVPADLAFLAETIRIHNEALAQPLDINSARGSYDRLKDMNAFYHERTTRETDRSQESGYPGELAPLEQVLSVGPARLELAESMGRIESHARDLHGPVPPDQIVQVSRALAEEAHRLVPGDTPASRDDRDDPLERLRRESGRNLQAIDALLEVNVAALIDERAYPEAREVTDLWSAVRTKRAESGLVDPASVQRELQELEDLHDARNPLHHWVAGGFGAAALAGGGYIALSLLPNTIEEADDAYDNYRAATNRDDAVSYREESQELYGRAEQQQIAQWAVLGIGAAALTYAVVSRVITTGRARRYRRSVVNEHFAFTAPVAGARSAGDTGAETIIVVPDGPARYNGTRLAAHIFYREADERMIFENARPVGSSIREFTLTPGDPTPAILVLETDG